MRIAFVAPPFAGHFNPLFVLARAARAAGYDVEFLTGARKLPIVAANGIRAVALGSVGEEALEAIANTTEPVGSNPVRMLAQFRQNLRLMPSVHSELHALWRDSPPGLVVADSVAPVAGLAARQLKIPWMTTIATPFSIETRFGTPSYCGGWSPGMGWLTRMRDVCGRGVIHTFKRGVGLLFRRELRALGLEQLYRDDGSETIYSNEAILGFGLRELEFEREWPVPFQMIGPVIDAPERAPALRLNESRPRVLVTHGTHLIWAKQSLVADVVALSKSFPKVHFVISLGEPGRAGQAGEQVAARVRLEPFVAYAPNLDRFDAIIHHGGAGVTYAAILGGIPSLVVPRDYDQFDYAARIVHHKLGLRVSSLGSKAAFESLQRLLDRGQWSADLGLFQRYARAYRPEATFLETVKRLSQSL
jgi:UDP:flavonoid glycosyltransferase YjiC (YdhE family)